MKKKLQLSLALIVAIFLIPKYSSAQLELSLTNQTHRIDFDSTKTKVNDSAYTANGITPTTAPGQLNSNAWEILGMSDGPSNFGDSIITGDFARGTATLGVGTGGLYSFTSNADGKMLGFQAGSSDMTPGSITLKVRNTSGVQLDSLRISYTFYSYSDQGRSNTLNSSYSTDSINYTALTALNDTSETAINTVALWVAKQKDTTLAVTLANGSYFYFRWTTDDYAGSGSRDELGIDNIEFTGLNSSGALSISSFTTNNPTCFGSTNGSARVITSGGTQPLTYNWSNGVITANNPNLGAGKYYITVTDLLGSSTSDSVTITQPDSIKITTRDSDVACFGGNTGFFTNTVTGGTAPYSYLWSNGDTSLNADSLTAGIYTLTVTDSLGCTKSKSDTIFQPAQIVIAFSDTASSCGSSDGSVKALISGGSSSFNYTWSNGVNGMGDSTYINNLAAGEYKLSVTDGFGCQVVDSVDVMGSGGILTNIIKTNPTAVGAFDGSLDLTVTGGMPAYTYLWSDGATTEDRMNLNSGTYSVTVTDMSGCTKVDSETLVSPSIPASLIITEINYNGPESGTDTSEFIEFVNAGGTTINLDGYSFVEGVLHTFTANDSITSGQYYVIAFDSSAFRNRYGINADAIWTSGSLSNSGEDITLVDNLGRTLDSVDYENTTPWPSGNAAGQPNGGGASIELADSTLDNNMGTNWRASADLVLGQIVNGLQVYGSPGRRPLPVSLNKIELSQTTISVYPNPTKGLLTLKVPEINYQERFQLINITGKVLRDELINQSTIELDLSKHANGVYFIRVGELSKKIILSK